MKATFLSQFAAVIFDMDGVLIESMQQHVRAWQEVFREYGVEIAPHEIFEREGEKARLTTQVLARRHGLDLGPEDMELLVSKKRELYMQHAPASLRPAARQTLEECRKLRLKTAIVTGSVLKNLRKAIPPEELSYFDVIVTSEEVVNSKPHPEPYLSAARQLDIAPEKCLVFENAPLGIRSAKAAGMTCIALTTTLPPEELSAADYIIGDLDQIGQLPGPDPQG